IYFLGFFSHLYCGLTTSGPLLSRHWFVSHLLLLPLLVDSSLCISFFFYIHGATCTFGSENSFQERTRTKA
ncbi:unnamed protein product, partial [Musa textilis]